MRPRIQTSRAFTLVELLVVIGIIALLISILIPALGAAKNQANRVACMSNMRQLATAWMMYATDFKGSAGACNWLAIDNQTSTANWLYWPAAPGVTPTASPDIFRTGNDADRQRILATGAYYKYFKSTKIYRCPFDTGPYTMSGPVYAVTSYGVNGAVNNFGRAGPNNGVWFFKTTQFAKDAIIFWEQEPLSNTFNDASNFPDEGISLRHAGRLVNYMTARNTPGLYQKLASVIATADGAVQAITLPEYERERVNGGRSRLWCVPARASANGH